MQAPTFSFEAALALSTNMKVVPDIYFSSVATRFSSALSLLAALYLQESKPAQHDGPHTLLAQCTKPLTTEQWGLDAFNAPDFEFHGLLLLDPTTRLPTLECLELAQAYTSEADWQEHHAFQSLQACCDQFAQRGDEAYTLLRGFITRHPVTTAAAQTRFLAQHGLQLATHFLASCYQEPQPHHLAHGQLYACTRCGSPLAHSREAEHLACTSRPCPAFDRPQDPQKLEALNSTEALVAQPHIQQYWCAPGFDEMAVFDTALAHQAALNPVLYPGRDRCDVALQGDAIGIDVKTHANPFVLARSLTRSIGGLELFQRKIIAINDLAIKRHRGYLDVLKRECAHLKVEFMSVAALKRRLKVGL